MKWLLVPTAFLLGLQLGPSKLELIPTDAALDIITTLEVFDPEKTIGPEFYDGYGFVFHTDARDSGPICVEKQFNYKTGHIIARRCITLAVLREAIWE